MVFIAYSLRWKVWVYCFFVTALALYGAVHAQESVHDQQDTSLTESKTAQGQNSAAPKPRIKNKIVGEELSIQRININFVQQKGNWGRPGKGFSMGSNGEPKSGTTWTARIITEIALHLCGSSSNTWCTMGGLIFYPNTPAPSYEWEMLYADTGELFMHFTGRPKHTILGLDVGGDCNPRGTEHVNRFETRSPCKAKPEVLTRSSLLQCMPDTSERCAHMMPSQDPQVLRMAVVFRDPRNVVISEHKMRIEFYRENNTPEMSSFIYQRFETIVSWQFLRWVWQTTFYENASHVMFYEDIKSEPAALVGLANFMGLNASLEQVKEVQELHKEHFPHGGFEAYGFPKETIEYMNDTMSRLLPRKMLDRYGLSTSCCK